VSKDREAHRVTSKIPAHQQAQQDSGHTQGYTNLNVVKALKYHHAGAENRRESYPLLPSACRS